MSVAFPRLAVKLPDSLTFRASLDNPEKNYLGWFYSYKEEEIMSTNLESALVWNCTDYTSKLRNTVDLLEQRVNEAKRREIALRECFRIEIEKCRKTGSSGSCTENEKQLQLLLLQRLESISNTVDNLIKDPNCV
jgi:hypothetical protein